MHEIATHVLRRDFAIKHCVVEPDDVGIAVANNAVATHRRVEPDNAGAEKGFYPVGVRQVKPRLSDDGIDPGHQLGLDTLRLDWWYDNGHNRDSYYNFSNIPFCAARYCL